MPPKFDETVKSAAPEKHRVLFDNFEQIAEAMNKHAQQRILLAPSVKSQIVCKHKAA